MLGAAAVSRVGAASLPGGGRPVFADDAAATRTAQRRPFNPIITLNGWSLPWRMKDGVRSSTWWPNPWCARSRPA